MKKSQVIKSLFESWKSFGRFEDIDQKYSSKEVKLIFLSDGLLGITTYDSSLDIEFGSMVLETMIQIKNRTTFEYIEDKENYRKFIISCNFLEGWLDWGSSIRGAWFDYYGGKFTPDVSLSNTGYDKDYIELSEEFINWLIDFLLDKNVEK